MTVLGNNRLYVNCNNKINPIYSLYRQLAELLIVKQVVHIVTNGLLRVGALFYPGNFVLDLLSHRNCGSIVVYMILN
jgi:hypothetical protein